MGSTAPDAMGPPVCNLPIAADPYNGGPCGNEAAGVRMEPTCQGHLDYYELFIARSTHRLDADGWEPIDDATIFLRERNAAVLALAKATGRGIGEVLEQVRAEAIDGGTI